MEPERGRDRRSGRPPRRRQLPVRRERLLPRRPEGAPLEGHLPEASATRSTRGEALDTSIADEVAEAMKEWALERGATHYTHMFQPLTGLTAEKHDSFFEPDGDGNAIAGFSGKELIQARAGRLVVPDRRHPRHLRGPRLHRLGPDEPGVPAREPERRAALHPDGVRVVDRRGARREDPAAALDGRALEVGDPRAAAARRRGVPARLHDRRPGAGVLPDRRAVLLRASRPGHHRADAVRREAAEGPRARRPLLRVDPGAHPRLHDRDGARAREARRAGQDPPQRGRPEPVRDRADLRELERRLRPPAADDADHAERRPQATGSSACCTRSRSPASTARASTTTGRWAPTPATT